jgi:hypothetical protein
MYTEPDYPENAPANCGEILKQVGLVEILLSLKGRGDENQRISTEPNYFRMTFSGWPIGV